MFNSYTFIKSDPKKDQFRVPLIKLHLPRRILPTVWNTISRLERRFESRSSGKKTHPLRRRNDRIRGEKGEGSASLSSRILSFPLCFGSAESKGNNVTCRVISELDFHIDASLSLSLCLPANLSPSPRIIRKGSPAFPLFLSPSLMFSRIVSRGRRIKRGNERKWIFERTFPEEEEEEEVISGEGLRAVILDRWVKICRAGSTLWRARDFFTRRQI